MKRLRITVEGKTYEVDVELLEEGGAAPTAPTAPAAAAAASSPAPSAPPPQAPPAGAGGVPSPLAAVVVSVDVQIGQTVQEGDKLLTLEAMKMNTFVTAPSAGKVSAIHVSQGSSVEEGQPLVELS